MHGYRWVSPVFVGFGAGGRRGLLGEGVLGGGEGHLRTLGLAGVVVGGGAVVGGTAVVGALHSKAVVLALLVLPVGGIVVIRIGVGWLGGFDISSVVAVGSGVHIVRPERGRPSIAAPIVGCLLRLLVTAVNSVVGVSIVAGRPFVAILATPVVIGLVPTPMVHVAAVAVEVAALHGRFVGVGDASVVPDGTSRGFSWVVSAVGIVVVAVVIGWGFAGFGLLVDGGLSESSVAFVHACAGAWDVLLLDSGRFDAAGFIDDVGAFWDVPLCDVGCVLAPAVAAFDVVIVVGGRRRGQIRYLAASGLHRLHLPHHLHRILQLFVLYLPFRLLLRPEAPFTLGRRRFLESRIGFISSNIGLHPLRFADSLVLPHPVSQKLPAASPAWNQIPILRRPLEAAHVPLLRSTHWLLLVARPAHRPLIDEGLSYHGTGFAGLLMRDQRPGVEPAAAVLALDECLLDVGVVGLRVELGDVVAGDPVLGDEFVEALGRLRTGSALLGRLQVLLVLPLLLAGLHVDGQALGAVPDQSTAYSRPQMWHTSAIGRLIQQQYRSQMLVHRINNIAEQELSVSEMGLDPHGEFVCFFDADQNALVVVDSMSVFKYFCIYRQQYFQKDSYSFREPLPHEIMMEPLQKRELVSAIVVSHRLEGGRQFLVVVYDTMLETTEFKYKGNAILKRQLYQFPTHILKACTFGEKLYVTMYDSQLSLIDLNVNVHSSQIKRRYPIPFMVSKESLVAQQQFRDKNSKIHELYPLLIDPALNSRLWQSTEGKLMLNQHIISQEFCEVLSYSSSYEEYVDIEMKESHPIKYQLSQCEKYLIGSQNEMRKGIHGQNFVIRSQKTNWNLIGKFDFHPEINQFWTHQQIYDYIYRTKSKEMPLKTAFISQDCLLFAYYNPNDRQLAVSFLIVDMTQRKRAQMIELEPSSDPLATPHEEFRELRQKFVSHEKPIFKLRNVKHPIVRIKWIGMTEMLFYDDFGHLFFCEFDEEHLKSYDN